VILVDTSVWIDYFNGRPTRAAERLDSLLGQQVLLTGDLILVEVLQGFRSERDFQRAAALMDLLEFQEMLGREVAVASANHYRHLRERGVTVRKTIDVVIGTFCIVKGHELLHSDRDFNPMAKHLGLQVVRL
jgi:predicted nucleic acid-binding protein